MLLELHFITPDMVNKANRLLGQIKRSFVIRDSKSMLQLYKATIRPILEYGSPVWSPWKKKQIIQIEQLQRRFTKLIDGMGGLSYNQRLEKLNLPTLQYRRRREQLIQVYKLLHGHYEADSTKFFQKDEFGVTRGHSWKLQTKRARLCPRANFFSVEIVKTWNSLPEAVVSSCTLNSFKNGIDRHLKEERFVSE